MRCSFLQSQPRLSSRQSYGNIRDTFTTLP
jgi:hypothetical protein